MTQGPGPENSHLLRGQGSLGLYISLVLWDQSRDNWVYPQQCARGIYCVLWGFLVIMTHKYLPIGVRWQGYIQLSPESMPKYLYQFV